ncbi:hypothetical protein ACWC4C_03450 [Streptomyces olivaceoviridis]
MRGRRRVVVPPPVDPTDDADLMWALGTRVRPTLRREEWTGPVLPLVACYTPKERQRGWGPRVNLEILGNTDGFLHAHVWPRFEWEPTDLARMPVWLYPRDRWTDEQYSLGPQHDPLRKAIGDELDRLRSTT